MGQKVKLWGRIKPGCSIQYCSVLAGKQQSDRYCKYLLIADPLLPPPSRTHLPHIFKAVLTHPYSNQCSRLTFLNKLLICDCAVLLCCCCLLPVCNVMFIVCSYVTLFLLSLTMLFFEYLKSSFQITRLIIIIIIIIIIRSWTSFLQFAYTMFST